MKRTRLLPFLLLAGCVLPPTEAERATFDAVAPEYRAYVEADATLAPDAKQRRLDTVQTWAIRVGRAK